MNIVMEFVEGVLETWIITYARSDLDQLAGRRLYVMTMLRNVSEVRVCSAGRYSDENSCHASGNPESQSQFHVGLREKREVQMGRKIIPTRFIFARLKCGELSFGERS